MSQIAHGLHRSSTARFGENVRGAKIFGYVEPRKASANAGIKRDTSEDMVPEQKNEVEERIQPKQPRIFHE